jgi:hypothetical protein
LISAAGNVTGNYILGNGSQLTGLPALYGNSNVSAFLSAFGTNSISTVGSVTSGNIYVSGVASIGGNLQANFLFGNGSQLTGISPGYGNSNVSNFLDSFGSNNISTTGNITSGKVSASGNITGGNLSVSTGTVTVGSIVNANANGVGNIGSASTYFHTVFAQATSAQYADLAEMYLSDAEYAPGTVVSFGGTKEITITSQDADARIAGVISTAPAYRMNSGQTGEYSLPLALTGRVPCSVVGAISKGDMMVSAGNGTARAESNPAMGTVIGKALEDFNGDQGVIEVVVGRL